MELEPVKVAKDFSSEASERNWFILVGQTKRVL